MGDRIDGRTRLIARPADCPRSGATGLRVLIAIFALGLALVAAGAATAQPYRSSPEPWILFTGRSPGHGVEQIFRIRPSGTGLKQLTRGDYPSSGPAFAPDGKRIVFARLGGGLFTMNVDGTSVRRLTTNGRDSYPAWSPDGKQIAFVRPLASGWRIFVTSASGKGARLLRSAPPAGRPTWTSRGLLIPTVGDLARIDPRSGRVQKMYGALIDAAVGMDATAVAPDLSTLTFVGSRQPDRGDKECGDGLACPRFGLFVQDLRKLTAPRMLARDTGPASFLPDGKRVVYVAGPHQILISPLSGDAPRRVKTGNLFPTTSSPPVWQPR
jgi:hypothetical protein